MRKTVDIEGTEFIPIADRVVVKYLPQPVESSRPSGLTLITFRKKNECYIYRVIAIGPGLRRKKLERYVPVTEVKVGDKVFMPPPPIGQRLYGDLFLFSVLDIFAVIEEE